MQVPLCAIAFVTVLFTLRLSTTKSSTLSENIKRIDIGGAVTLVLAIFLLLLVSNRALLQCYITGFFATLVLSVQAFYIPLFYQAVAGKTASETGIWLIVVIVAGLAGTLSSGYAMQRTGKYYAMTVISYVLVLVGTGIVFFSSGVVSVSTVGLAVGMAVTEFGNHSGNNTLLTAVIANAGQADQAIATAVSFLFRSLASITGLSVGSTLVQVTLRYLLHRRLSGDDAQEIAKRIRESLSYLNKLDPITKGTVIQSYEDAMQVAFLLTTALATLAVVSSLFIKEKALSPPGS
ncbi:hypothetical protein APHAL10511_000754 [Amanita phalloides]|nr:hypothetical protein APHAL10511_000754 [Amanita phalloides]